ncbi:wax ester/triacylglycerol synthase domain-containing protein [Streptomyces hesseae]|uniref:diacylglycerol O-acyltransferase n=1 Tax=Streptomyces hesseae TaxID=3075519 RepID=A0ABU2ST15_9ACTN|nr:wax ester/triacylglycerol synthase domain-containing protein [Streptomyces sp. DSM 40473]MDT0451160.1 wax ester/triacylglycerol synthase family O-acyltransferase [Streptomyces sp. DSM 40473]
MTPHPHPTGLALGAPAAGHLSGSAMPPLDAWMHRDQNSGTICLTWCLVAWFRGSPPSLTDLRDRVRRRWGRYERLRLTPATPGDAPDAWPWWTPGPDFSCEHHVVASSAPDGPEVRAAQLLAQPLGPARPPWQLHLLPTDEGFALLLRTHHALLDGMSAITLLRALLDAPTTVPGPRARPAAGRAEAAGPPRFALTRALADVLPRARPLPFHGPVDSRRAVGWSRVPMAELSTARDALRSGRASANAVFLAATAGALRAAGATGRLPRLPGVCAMVPVDVRDGDGPEVLGNHYATVRVPLPAHDDPLRRLAAVDRFTRRAELKRRARAQALLVSSRPRRYGLLGDALGRYANSPLYSSLLCSSVATHASGLRFGAAPLVGVGGLPPLGPERALAVTMFLHDTQAVVAVVTDHGHQRLAARLPTLIREEIHAMRP